MVNKAMDETKIKMATTWGIAAIIFLTIFVVCIGFIFAPVEEVSETSVVSHPATSVFGAKLLGESWKRYPEYTLGLGIAGILSAAGACYCIYVIYNGGNMRHEAG